MSLQNRIDLGLLDHKSNDTSSRSLPPSLNKREVILRMMQMLAVTLSLLQVTIMMTTLVIISTITQVEVIQLQEVLRPTLTPRLWYHIQNLNQQLKQLPIREKLMRYSRMKRPLCGMCILSNLIQIGGNNTLNDTVVNCKPNKRILPQRNCEQDDNFKDRVIFLKFRCYQRHLGFSGYLPDF